MKASRLILLAIALSSAILHGQKKEDILSMQRDIANMDDHVKQLQKTLDEKTAALTALMQQSIDASNKTSAAMAAMQRDVDQKMAEQGTKLVAPVASMGAKVDEMSGDFRTVSESVRELVRRLNDMDGKLKDISEAVRTLAAQQIQPPPKAEVPPGGTAQQAADTPPPGMSADLSYTAALSDYNGKKDDLAIEEFAQFLKYYSSSANGPSAQYYIGQIYYRGQDWENAAKAFDAVLEKFPKNAKTSEAQYYKACALLNGKHKTAAGEEFKSFIRNYPDSPHVTEAHKHLRELAMEGPTRRKN
jgi:TolA-binding protein